MLDAHETREPDDADATASGLAAFVDRVGGRLPSFGAALGELRDLDHAVYAAVAETPTPTIDVPLRRLSSAANYSRIWLSVAGALALFGGPRARRAALSGAAACGVTSAVVSLGIKPLGRARPDRALHQVPAGRQVKMPTSSSFPSGHAAAGFAFASAVGTELPVLTLPLGLMALTVAYSRVHTGVHYPYDTVIGATLGTAIGQAVAYSLHRHLFFRHTAHSAG